MSTPPPDELWRYHDERCTAVVFRTSESTGRLLIHVTGRPAIDLLVPLGPSAPTAEDDAEWFTIVDTYASGDRIP